MHLLQLLLPVYDASGKPFPKALFDRTRAELAGQCGGVTAYLRSPAVGLWENEDGECVRDDVLLFEVMVDEWDREWWRAYRRQLEQRFAQDEILLRAIPIEQL